MEWYIPQRLFCGFSAISQLLFCSCSTLLYTDSLSWWKSRKRKYKCLPFRQEAVQDNNPLLHWYNRGLIESNSLLLSRCPFLSVVVCHHRIVSNRLTMTGKQFPGFGCHLFISCSVVSFLSNPACVLKFSVS